MPAPDPFRWTVRVTAVERGRATAFARTHRLELGPPLSFDEAEPRLTALECLLGALGADLVSGFKELAHRRRLQVDEVEALVQGELNDPLAHLGVVGQAGHPGLERATIKVYVSSLEDPGALRKLWDEMLERSPLARTLRPVVQLELSVKFTL